METKTKIKQKLEADICKEIDVLKIKDKIAKIKEAGTNHTWDDNIKNILKTKGYKCPVCQKCAEMGRHHIKKKKSYTKSKKCLYCGKVFEYKNKRGAYKKYCSKRCRSDARNERRNIGKLTKKCEWCGNKFEGLKHYKYCSEKCLLEANRENSKTRHKKKCGICGETFYCQPKKQKYCSDKCGSIAAAKTMRNTKIKKKCKRCGKEFITNNLNANQLYCSRHCANVAWRDKRRAMKNEAFLEEVSPNYIYKRDNGICQVCGKKVDKKYKYPHPKATSVDHIIPLSKGGEHSKRNCQLTHWECNYKKRDKITTKQLNLLG